ncbi:hypothetical protein [Amycolatopsis sp. CA-128772]|uniref:hypothetical protein n=1 Tax=Amycolatopsis sp. CA-128772 TaxID=2073159 RepID=UPI000CD2C8FF|nr:hypothetical protein [Amycolatopsis sp. CA-128772]
METDYERRLRETVAEVQSCDAIRVHRFEQGTLSEYLGDAAHAFELIGRVERNPLPADLAHNFHRRSDVELAWRAKEPDEAIAGEFSLVHVADALLAGPSARLAELSACIPDKRLLEELRPFDTQPTGGTGSCAALRLTGNATTAEIWYFTLTHGIMRLDLGYGEYLDLLLRVRGLHSWQYLFAELDPAELHLSAVFSELRSGLEFLARTFPGDDLENLMSRLNALERRANGPS